MSNDCLHVTNRTLSFLSQAGPHYYNSGDLFFVPSQKDSRPDQGVLPLQKGLNLFYAHSKLEKDIVVETRCPEPVLEFGCLLSGHIQGNTEMENGKRLHWEGQSAHAWISYCRPSQSSITYFSREPIQVLGFQIFSPLLETFVFDCSGSDEQLHTINCQLPDGARAVNSILSQIIGQVAEQVTGTGELERLFLIAKSYELLFRLRQTVQECRNCSSTTRIKAVNRAVRMIQQNFWDSLSLDQIAREAGLCPTGLNAEFKKEFGITVFGFLRRQRLSNAKKLMEDHGKTVSEAAWESGYQSLSSFHRAFYAQYGVSPGFFSKNRRNILR